MGVEVEMKRRGKDLCSKRLMVAYDKQKAHLLEVAIYFDHQ